MRQINPDNVAPWFNPWKLKAVYMFNGYENYGAPLANVLHVSEKTVRDKLSQSRLTHEETIAIAKSLHFTEEQYCEIFAKNLKEDEDGDRAD